MRPWEKLSMSDTSSASWMGLRRGATITIGHNFIRSVRAAAHDKKCSTRGMIP